MNKWWKSDFIWLQENTGFQDSFDNADQRKAYVLFAGQTLGYGWKLKLGHLNTVICRIKDVPRGTSNENHS